MFHDLSRAPTASLTFKVALVVAESARMELPKQHWLAAFGAVWRNFFRIRSLMALCHGNLHGRDAFCVDHRITFTHVARPGVVRGGLANGWCYRRFIHERIAAPSVFVVAARVFHHRYR